MSRDIARAVGAGAAFLLLTCLDLEAQAPEIRPRNPPPPTEQVDDSHLPPGIFDEPRILTRAAEEFERRTSSTRRPGNGFYVELGNSITGAGFPSAGPGYRHHLFNDRALFSAAATVSARLYNSVQLRLEFPELAGEHLSGGGQMLYQDAVRVNYYGLGAESDIAARSGYRLRTTDTSAFLSLNLNDVRLTGRLGSLAGLRVTDMAGFSVSYPNTRATFDNQSAPGIARQPAYVYTELGLAVDRRNEPGHPTSGGLYQVTAARYQDQDREPGGGLESFDRYELSATHYLSAGTDNWILSLRGFAALTDTPPGGRVPFYLTPSLGGKTTLRGYGDYRFHDDQMTLAQVESRWALLKHLDVALFAEYGRIGPTLGDMWRSDLKQSYGGGVRFHSDRLMIGRADLAHSAEGWRFIFSMSEPLQRSRPYAGATSVVPFVP